MIERLIDFEASDAGDLDGAGGGAEAKPLRAGWLQRLTGGSARRHHDEPMSTRNPMSSANEPITTRSPMSAPEPRTTASPMSGEENFFAE